MARSPRAGRPVRPTPVRTCTVLALALLLTLGACGGDDEGEPAPTAKDERANLTILSPDDLPDGWRRIDPKDRIDGNPGKPRYCGVDVEPQGVTEGRVAFYEAGSVPSSVLEYGMVATEEAATASLDALLAVQDDCVDEGYTVEPAPASELADLGDQRVGWDFVSEEDPTLGFRAVVFRRGDTVVTLVATGQTAVPTAEQTEIARLVDRRLQG